MTTTRKRPRLPVDRLSFWSTAAVVGVIAVAYAEAIRATQMLYFDWLALHPLLMALASPLAFLAAAAPVALVAPEARGSGIPQVLQAIAKAKRMPGAVWSSPLVSLRTAGVKVLSSLLGVLGGASIGREGPTVQIAATAFAWVGRQTRAHSVRVDFEAYLIAGGAAGVAAAFNTPLAGIAFALEEIAEGAFAHFKRRAMVSVIVAGVTAQAFLGNYLYFGRPHLAGGTPVLYPLALVLGALSGALGGGFARLLAVPLRLAPRLWWARALVCGAVCAALAYATDGASAGSGYETVRKFMDGGMSDLPFALSLGKLAATVLSYHSGMAGGIFAPALSIGAGFGVLFGKLLAFPDLRACALIAMVGFFSGAIQAPLTGVIIVMEMTDGHALVIPFMISAFLAQRIGQIFMPKPLYRYLADRATLADQAAASVETAAP